MGDAQKAFDAFVHERSKLENVKRTSQNLILYINCMHMHAHMFGIPRSRVYFLSTSGPIYIYVIHA